MTTLSEHLPLHDRREAGQLLVGELDALRCTPELVVLALPQGGVAVGYEIARALEVPLDVFMACKVSLSGRTDTVIGAIASGGIQVIDPPARAAPPQAVQAALSRQRQELARREQVYRGTRPPFHLQGHCVLLVDDGITTGATMEAAVRAVRQQHPSLLAVAAPVVSAMAAQRLRPLVDLLVCGAVPEPFGAVSQWYRDFPTYTDEDVQVFLDTPAFT